MSRRYRHRYDSFWPRYVPVAERQANAQKAMNKLRKKGAAIHPVTIEGRTIARTFWGKGWCNHLESFGDYSNRLPRGRSYVRNGSVCHLAIARGRVEAQVAGSSLYRVEAKIKPLATAKWTRIKRRCSGRIGSLIELLQGTLSDEIMGAVTDREQGLFPKPGEIDYTCDCPDWAVMCKHVSAVMYGIGARLDEQPELLFLLRGVDHHDLVSDGTDAAAALSAAGSARRSRRRVLADTDITRVFGVELEDEMPSDAGANLTKKRAPKKKTTRKRGKRAPSARPKTSARPKPQKVASTKGRPKKTTTPFKATGPAVRTLRRRLSMTVTDFAHAVGVSPATVMNWEKRRGALRPQSKSLTGLQALHTKSEKK